MGAAVRRWSVSSRSAPALPLPKPSARRRSPWRSRRVFVAADRRGVGSERPGRPQAIPLIAGTARPPGRPDTSRRYRSERRSPTRSVMACAGAGDPGQHAEPGVIVDDGDDLQFGPIHQEHAGGHIQLLPHTRNCQASSSCQGRYPPKADRDAFAAALLGPLFYRRWFSREPTDTQFLELIIRTVVTGLRGDARKAKRDQNRR